MPRIFIIYRRDYTWQVSEACLTMKSSKPSSPGRWSNGLKATQDSMESHSEFKRSTIRMNPIGMTELYPFSTSEGSMGVTWSC